MSSSRVVRRVGLAVVGLLTVAALVLAVVGVSLVGIYVASALLIGYFMRRHGRFGWVKTVIVSVGVPLVFFLVFERWFLVPLAKGPIEQMLGF